MTQDEQFLRSLGVGTDITPRDLRPGPVRPPVVDFSSSMAVTVDEDGAHMSAEDFGRLLDANHNMKDECDRLEREASRAKREARVWMCLYFVAACVATWLAVKQ